MGPVHAGAGFKPKVLCSSFKSSSPFAVVSQISCDWDFMCSAIMARMTFKSSQQTLFTSKGMFFFPSVRYSRGIKGHFTFETLLKSLSVLIIVNDSACFITPITLKQPVGFRLVCRLHRPPVESRAGSGLHCWPMCAFRWASALSASTRCSSAGHDEFT